MILEAKYLEAMLAIIDRKVWASRLMIKGAFCCKERNEVVVTDGGVMLVMGHDLSALTKTVTLNVERFPKTKSDIFVVDDFTLVDGISIPHIAHGLQFPEYWRVIPDEVAPSDWHISAAVMGRVAAMLKKLNENLLYKGSADNNRHVFGVTNNPKLTLILCGMRGDS